MYLVLFLFTYSSIYSFLFMYMYKLLSYSVLLSGIVVHFPPPSQGCEITRAWVLYILEDVVADIHVHSPLA